MIKVDTQFAKLAIRYLENEDDGILNLLTELPATEHIYYHCTKYNPDPNSKFSSKHDFIKSILSEQWLKKELSNFKKIVAEIDSYIGLENEIAEETFKSLPHGINISSNMYVTLGYFSTGSVSGNENFNVDLTLEFEDIKELIYNSIHEFHHVGYSKFKKMPIPSIDDIKTHGDMLNLMIYLLQAEGFATYAPFYKRKSENRLNVSDYRDVNNKELMAEYHNKFLEDYYKLSSHKYEILAPDTLMNEYLMPLDKNRLLYKFGLYVCLRIEEEYGKDKLIETLTQPLTELVEMIRLFKY